MDESDGTITYTPDCEIHEGVIWLINPRRTYAIILTEDDERISFNINDLAEDGRFKLKQGDWVVFEKHITKYRTIAVRVRNC